MTISKELHRLANEMTGSGLPLQNIVVDNDAIKELPMLLSRNHWKHVLVVADERTFHAAGNRVCEHLKDEGVHYQTTFLTENVHGQVIADEPTLIELFQCVTNETDVIIAVGSGTIHDIVRFVSYKMDRPFISVPTAASVDGFTSKGAPLILRGMKQTVQTRAPIAVLADLDILSQAPAQMTAAGFGDILGKYTSLLDWKISHLIGGEPYHEKAAVLTKQSLDACVNHVDAIASHDSTGIKILMDALIESGLVMLILNHSRPASGGEHHLSHYWEMDLLKHNQRQLLHGAKVGVATTLISDHYKQMRQQVTPDHFPNDDKGKRLQQHWQKIAGFIDELPDRDRLQKWLTIVGGPSTTEELGIDHGHVQNSLQEAHHLRDRCTGLFLFNEGYFG
ncbi:sn-glycerol-1-phosphate dehydrogenase [Tuberibacillus sp. Marseille-P3662]|uniref:sn-glycerol-1-phosphate dehydrogenase n=1 Tax=Tuberibacillus sp. Marseille-P3662 TaxID=1965358 RepID=UPI0020CB3611|nr:sn-glycerol-1-phosphate dehydrogenase [Tuberibacillus sp. Marseille-P3662]